MHITGGECSLYTHRFFFLPYWIAQLNACAVVAGGEKTAHASRCRGWTRVHAQTLPSRLAACSRLLPLAKHTLTTSVRQFCEENVNDSVSFSHFRFLFSAEWLIPQRVGCFASVLVVFCAILFLFLTSYVAVMCCVWCCCS